MTDSTDYQMINISVPRPRPMYKPPAKARDRCQVDCEVEKMIIDLTEARLPWPCLWYGEPGSGKTCSAMLMVDAFGGWYATLNDMVKLIQQAARGEAVHSSGYKRTVFEVEADWTRANLAVLDEIGERTEVSESHYEITKKLIDLRERDGLKPTVYISNRSPSELSKIYSDSIASRLTMGTVVEMNGDRRQGKPTAVEVKA